MGKSLSFVETEERIAAAVESFLDVAYFKEVSIPGNYSIRTVKVLRTTAGDVRSRDDSSGDRHYRIRFNWFIARDQIEEFIARTVPHELAHMLAEHRYGFDVQPHGKEWDDMCVVLTGSTQARQHEYNVPDFARRRQRRFDYRCACTDNQYWLSTTMHNRLQNPSNTQHCRNCGSELEHTGVVIQ